MSDERADVQVSDAEDAERYEATVDGELAGFANYQRRDGRTVVTHTEVFDEFAGKGVAGTIARVTLDDIRNRGEQVVPLCPFFKKWIDEHADYQDLVDQELYAALTKRRLP